MEGAEARDLRVSLQQAAAAARQAGRIAEVAQGMLGMSVFDRYDALQDPARNTFVIQHSDPEAPVMGQ
jgi:hypothetical protein